MNKDKEHKIIIFPDYTMSYKKTLNSKHRAKLKIESQRYRNIKKQKTEIENLILSKEQVQNADLYKLVLNKIMKWK